MNIDQIIEATGLSKERVISALQNLSGSIPSGLAVYRNGGWRKIPCNLILGLGRDSSLVYEVLPTI